MVTKKKPVAFTALENLSLDEQAVHFHESLADAEKGVATTYWLLGDTLERIRKEPKYGEWKTLMKHCDRLGLRRSCVTRSLRIRKRHPDIKDVTDLSLFEALGQKLRQQASCRTESGRSDDRRRVPGGAALRAGVWKPQSRPGNHDLVLRRSHARRLEARRPPRTRQARRAPEGQAWGCQAPRPSVAPGRRLHPQEAPLGDVTMKKPIVVSFVAAFSAWTVDSKKPGSRSSWRRRRTRTRKTIAANRPRLPVLGDIHHVTAAQACAAARIGKKEDIDLVCGVPALPKLQYGGQAAGTPRPAGRRTPGFR